MEMAVKWARSIETGIRTAMELELLRQVDKAAEMPIDWIMMRVIRLARDVRWQIETQLELAVHMVMGKVLDAAMHVARAVEVRAVIEVNLLTMAGTIRTALIGAIRLPHAKAVTGVRDSRGVI